MRAKDFIPDHNSETPIDETVSPGHSTTLALPGPGGTRYPRGYNPSTMIGGMNRTNARNLPPSKNFTPNVDATPDYFHARKIDQRVAGGMTLEDAITARATQAGLTPNEMATIYHNYKSRIK